MFFFRSHSPCLCFGGNALSHANVATRLVRPFSIQKTELASGLYIVGTPIGNLEDVTFRSLNVLASVDCIACEDTRTTAKLLHKFEIENKELISYVEARQGQVLGQSKQHEKRLLQHLKQGGTAALVSESGMPVVSDPGCTLVSHCHELGIPVFVVPGPCAAVSAVAVSGFAGDKFLFEGFLPKKRSKRVKVLQELAQQQNRTLVFYESPNRLAESLQDMISVFGPDREAGICKELTKQYESTTVLPLRQLVHTLPKEPLGEYVIVVKGAGSVENEDD